VSGGDTGHSHSDATAFLCLPSMYVCVKCAEKDVVLTAYGAVFPGQHIHRFPFFFFS
jgi:hypothetical protein